MRAVRVTKPDVIEVADVPEPVASGDVVVRANRVGICGTDTKIVSGKIPVDYPRVLGHEMIGQVASAPTGSPFPEGTRVLVDPGVACGWCDLCLAGRPNICVNGGLLGRDTDGVFTEYVEVPTERLVAVPDSVSDKASGLLQVLGTCIHAVKRVNPFPGQVALVIGLGVGGQLITQLLALRGMTVIGVTRSEWKQRLAKDSGAAAVAGPDEASAIVADLTGGKGPALAVEAVGIESTLSDAIDLVGTGGEVLVYGTLTGRGQGLPYYAMYHKELTIHNPRAALIGDYADGVALAAAGKLSLEPIVTHELDLESAAKAFELVADPSSLKVVMEVR